MGRRRWSRRSYVAVSGLLAKTTAGRSGAFHCRSRYLETCAPQGRITKRMRSSMTWTSLTQSTCCGPSPLRFCCLRGGSTPVARLGNRSSRHPQSRASIVGGKHRATRRCHDKCVLHLRSEEDGFFSSCTVCVFLNVLCSGPKFQANQRTMFAFARVPPPPAPQEEERGFWDEVLLYFWDDRDGSDFSGWWFGPKVGGDQAPAPRGL